MKEEVVRIWVRIGGRYKTYIMQDMVKEGGK